MEDAGHLGETGAAHGAFDHQLPFFHPLVPEKLSASIASSQEIRRGIFKEKKNLWKGNKSNESIYQIRGQCDHEGDSMQQEKNLTTYSISIQVHFQHFCGVCVGALNKLTVAKYTSK